MIWFAIVLGFVLGFFVTVILLTCIYAYFIGEMSDEENQ